MNLHTFTRPAPVRKAVCPHCGRACDIMAGMFGGVIGPHRLPGRQSNLSCPGTGMRPKRKLNRADGLTRKGKLR